MTKVRLLLILSCVFNWSFASGADSQGQLKRLDPHGAPGLLLQEVPKTDDCLVCHSRDADKKWKLKSSAGNSCALCHAALPHGGVAEHLKKKTGGSPSSEITCVSCHFAHRSDARPGIAGHPSKMIRKDCTECHRW